MKNGKSLLPAPQRLRAAFDYDQSTGVFTWKRGPRVGRKAGVFDGRYIYLMLDSMRFAAHRAAFAYMNGEWPDAPAIDHLDGIGWNNSFSNLREADHSTNQQNQRRPHVSNKTGLLGVVPVPSRKSPRKFRAQIWLDGKPKNLGYYLTPMEAHVAYVDAKRALHGGCML